MQEKTIKNTYLIGDLVFVKSFKVNGIIEKLLRKNKYLVSVNSMTVEVCDEDLSEAKLKKDKKDKNYVPYTSKAKGKEKNKAYDNSLSSKIVDLHGVKLEDLEEIVLTNISNAILQNYKEISFMHGIGHGILKKALPDILNRTSSVKEYKESSNPGITIVYL